MKGTARNLWAIEVNRPYHESVAPTGRNRNYESKQEHVPANARAIEIKLAKKDLADLDEEIPRPKSKKPLLILRVRSDRRAEASFRRSAKSHASDLLSDTHAGEHRGIFSNERGQLGMRGFEFFNGLF